MTLLVLAAQSQSGDSRVSGFFAEQAVPAAMGRNVVNVILVDFRSLDTLGEIVVLVVAALGVYALLKLRPRGGALMFSLILSTTARAIMPLTLVFSIYLLMRGHNAPGGGFVGGLVAAVAFVLASLADGLGTARRALRVDPHLLMAVGLSLALGSGVGTARRRCRS
jgi:multicomponent Na+:H+ antiporter subunit A